MVQELSTLPTAFGRLGMGLSQGFQDVIPREVERSRLSSGLRELEATPGLTPFQQFSRLITLPGMTPQSTETAGSLLRQQAIINSLEKMNKQTNPYANSYLPAPNREGSQPKSATTTESTKAALNPYIPPSGIEQEQMARKLMADEPLVYRDIDSARSAIARRVSDDIQQSNARLNKRTLENQVQDEAEQKLKNEIGEFGAQIPGTVLNKLKQAAVDDVRTGKLSADEAKSEYAKQADRVSRDFSAIRSWGGLGLITQKPKSLIDSINILRKDAKKGGYQKEAADAMIAENEVTPEFAYASLYPVSDIKSLNDELKRLPDISPRFEKIPGSPGLAGIGLSRKNNENAREKTLEIAPSLVKAMGLEGSPLSIGYELRKKGYDAEAWKEYLIQNSEDINLSRDQRDELKKPTPTFYGWLNDWWLKAFSGVK